MAKKRVISAAIILLVLVAAVCILLYGGTIQINHPSKERYPVRGVDVSHYQGDIDWNVLSGQGISFAYIKATEGSSLQDEKFSVNWSAAAETGLRIGAYHFFSFETGGKTQAENFLETVSAAENMLPPAADVEPYGGSKADMLGKSGAIDELAVWLKNVEDALGMKPVIYTTTDCYDVIHSAFPEHDVWIRSVYGAPPKQIEWKMWQYSNRMKLSGYSGEEKYIDMNVFSGSEEEFKQYGHT